MSAHAQPEQGSPAGDLIAELDGLRRRTRTDRQAYWLPLFLFGGLGLVSAPLYTTVGSEGTTPPGSMAGELAGGFLGHADVLGWIWLAALAAGCLGVPLWYRRHAARTGVASPTWAYPIAGAATVGLALVLPWEMLYGWDFAQELLRPALADLYVFGLMPYVVIAVHMAVLAFLDRSIPLAATAFGCLAAAYTASAWLHATVDESRLPEFSYVWAELLPTAVLLSVGTAAVIVRRRRAA